ncbi:ABC-2 type transport system permease protein [Stackebrandtia albiflava]|uniref:ABC-2 type transport system permease protein n=1 Tax=Stackebrandtia albiflava TaxID=406432 RepID=A0A562UY50_9ACTN|nr:ABC transporter permease [Stackebrandtia albiflava]TWJ10549.1 ABC-2 type transport system permease protein [Stackebrandtia albiflava]
MATTTEPGKTGAIHNIGYRRYDGPRLGRRDIFLALYGQTLKGTFGIGRGLGAKIFPWLLFGSTVLPAFILVAVQTQIPPGPEGPQLLVEFGAYTVMVQAVPSLFLASQAPQAVSRDLRFHTLPLYFSRPLSYVDYVRARVAGIATGLGILVAAPLLVMYIGALLLEFPIGDMTLKLLAALVSLVFLVAMFTMIGTLIASVTPRRGLGVAAIIAVLSGSYMAATFLQALLGSFVSEPASAWGGLLSPITIYDGIQAFLFGWSPVDAAPSTPAVAPGAAAGLTLLAAAVAITALCYRLLLLRYRKVSRS